MQKRIRMNQIIYKERKNTNSMKWDNCGEKFGNEKLLPLWVADMDFEVPECVKDAIKEYADFGVFGYYIPLPRVIWSRWSALTWTPWGEAWHMRS